MRRWGAAYIFLALWVLFLAIHGGLEYVAAIKEAREHGQPFQTSEFGLEWARATFENLQSEAWQILAAILIVDNVRAKKKWFRASDEEA